MWTFCCNLNLSGRPSYKWVYSSPKWNWYLQNAGLTADTLKMQTVSYNLSGLVVEGTLLCIPHTIRVTTLKGWISVNLDIMLYFHEFLFYETLDTKAKERKGVCRKERWGTCFIFLFGKGKPARFFRILSP